MIEPATTEDKTQNSHFVGKEGYVQIQTDNPKMRQINDVQKGRKKAGTPLCVIFEIWKSPNAVAKGVGNKINQYIHSA